MKRVMPQVMKHIFNFMFKILEGGDVTLSAIVGDDVAVDGVWLNVVFPDATELNYTASAPGAAFIVVNTFDDSGDYTATFRFKVSDNQSSQDFVGLNVIFLSFQLKTLIICHPGIFFGA